MKYYGMKTDYCISFLLCFILLIWAVFLIIDRWNAATIGVRALMLIACFVLIIVEVSFLLKIGFSQSSALFQEDGIHIFLRKQAELIVIPWESVKECKWIRGERQIGYLMLIFRWDALFCGKPLATYSNPYPSLKQAKPYLLDEKMEMLARKKVTLEEIRNMPFVLAVDRNKHLFEKGSAMWRQRNSTVCK